MTDDEKAMLTAGFAIVMDEIQRLEAERDALQEKVGLLERSLAMLSRELERPVEPPRLWLDESEG